MLPRAEVVPHIVSLVSQGASIHLTGPRLSGRTEVLKSAQSALVERGFTVLAVRGMGTGGLALAALRTALPVGVRPPAGADVGAIADAAAEYLEQGRGIILIDDAERLDEVSWATLESIHARTTTPMIVSTPSARTMAERGERLSHMLSPVVRVSLDPMTQEELHDVFQARLGASVSPTVSARLHAKAAGLPGLALTQLHAAVSRGRIRKRGAQWVDEADLWTAEASAGYEALLSEHPAEVRDAVEALSLTGAVTLETAVRLIGQPLLEQLDDRELIQLLGGEQQTMVAVTPPGIGVYFRNQPPSVRRTRVFEQVTSSIDAPPQVRAHLDQIELDAREGDGAFLSGAQAPVVARLLVDSHRLDLAAAKEEWEAAPTAATATRYLWVQLAGEPDAAMVEHIFAVTPIDAAPADDAVGALDALELRYLHARWALHHAGSLDDALGALRPLPGDPADFIEALELLRFSLRQEFEAIDPRYEEILATRAVGTTLVAHLASVILARCHTLTGRSRDALAVLDAVTGTPPPSVSIHLTLCRGLALYAGGRFDEAIAYAEDEAHAAVVRRDRVALVGHSYVRAAALIALGRFAEAHASAGLVLATASHSVPLPFNPDRSLLVVLAIAAIRTGRDAAATSLIERASGHGAQSRGLPMADVAWVEGALLLTTGDRSAAKAVFARLGEELRSLNYTLAANVAELAAHLVDYDEESSRFAGTAAEIGGDLYVAYLESRRALADGDAEALLSVAEHLHELGAASEALQAHAHASRLFRNSGHDEGAGRARAAARLIAEETGDLNWVSSTLPESALTARENEIVRCVAAGMSNIDISGELFLSVRTVESHLRNIRRKTGAGDRSDIGHLATPHP